MKKYILLLLTCLALAISSCGKSGGDDEGKGGGGDNPDGKKTDLKKVLKFNADSDTLNVRSIDFSSQQSVPIALDLAAIKEATAQYKVTIKARVLASRSLPKGSELPSNKIIYSFDKRGGDHFFTLEKGGKDSTQLFYQINKIDGTDKDYLVLQIEFYVSYKNGSENKQDGVSPVALIAERKIEIQNQLDPHIFLHSEMGKQQSFKVLYTSSIPADVLKDMSYVDKANYTVELAPDSIATTILTPKLEFRVPGTVESDVQFIPNEDRTTAFSEINVTRDNFSSQSDSYKFYRCGDDQDEELYFIKPGGNSRVSEITAPISPTPTPKTPEDLKYNLAMFVKNIVSCNSIRGSKLAMTFGAGVSNSVAFKVPGNPSVEIGDKTWSTWTSPTLDYGSDLWMALLNTPTPVPNQVDAFLKINGKKTHEATIRISNQAETAILKWNIKRDEKERHIALLQGGTKELNIKVDYMPGTAKTSGRKIRLKINDMWKDDDRGFSRCVLLFNAVESPPYVTVDPKDKDRKKCTDDGFIVYVRDDIAKDILIKASAQSISGAPQDITINTPKCDDTDTCQVASFNDEGMPVRISVDNTKACYYPMFTYESEGMIRDTGIPLDNDKSCYQSPRPPSKIPSLIMPGAKKHFIVEVSSVKDSSIYPATMTAFYLHAISIKGMSDKTLEEREIVDNKDVKMYKLTLADVDNTKGAGINRTIIGLKPCAISSVQATDSLPQCQTNPSGENRQFFLIEDSRSNRNEGDGYSTIGVRVFPSGDEVSYVGTTKNLWAYKEATTADIKPNIDLRGFEGADYDHGGRGWRQCKLQALRHGVGGMFDYDQVYGSYINRICPSRYKTSVGTANITPIAINMTNLDYNGSCPQNKAMVLPGEELSVMYTDFADLKVNYSGFDQDWDGLSIENQRQIVIRNYSGQLTDKKFEETDYSANFAINLPVGDPNLSRCRDDDVYGVKTETPPTGKHSANLNLNIEKFDLTTGQTTTKGYGTNPSSASGVITTQMCSNIAAYGGAEGQECNADGIRDIGNNFHLGICQKRLDGTTPYEACSIDQLI